MNFSEFLEAMCAPIYEAKGEKVCPEGFRWNKKLQQCVPLENTENGGDKTLPDPIAPYQVWGATGLNGDGYAREEGEVK